MTCARAVSLPNPFSISKTKTEFCGKEAQQVLAKRDPRIGVCLDAGWITQAGFDAAKVFQDYRGRVFDIHFKDKKVR